MKFLLIPFFGLLLMCCGKEQKNTRYTDYQHPKVIQDLLSDTIQQFDSSIYHSKIYDKKGNLISEYKSPQYLKDEYYKENFIRGAGEKALNFGSYYTYKLNDLGKKVKTSVGFYEKYNDGIYELKIKDDTVTLGADFCVIINILGATIDKFNLLQNVQGENKLVLDIKKIEIDNNQVFTEYLFTQLCKEIGVHKFQGILKIRDRYSHQWTSIPFTYKYAVIP